MNVNVDISQCKHYHTSPTVVQLAVTRCKGVGRKISMKDQRKKYRKIAKTVEK